MPTTSTATTTGTASNEHQPGNDCGDDQHHRYGDGVVEAVRHGKQLPRRRFQCDEALAHLQLELGHHLGVGDRFVLILRKLFDIRPMDGIGFTADHADEHAGNR